MLEMLIKNKNSSTFIRFTLSYPLLEGSKVAAAK